MCQFLTITHVFFFNRYFRRRRSALSGLYIYNIYRSHTWIRKYHRIRMRYIVGVLLLLVVWRSLACANTRWLSAHCLGGANRVITRSHVCARICSCVYTLWPPSRTGIGSAKLYPPIGFVFFSRLSSRYYLFICVSVGHVTPNMMDIWYASYKLE